MRNRYRIIGISLLALYLCFSASTHLFFHTHYFPWGKITHSHIFFDSNHEHSQEACELISFIALSSSNLKLADIVILSLPFILVTTLAIPVKKMVSLSFVKSYLLRAPPVLGR